MKLSRTYLGEGCGKVKWNTACGSWSLKHNEHYYCDDCFIKLMKKNKEKLK